MKTKKVDGKLIFKKDTVIDLNPKELKTVKGGVTGWCSGENTGCHSFCGTIWPCS